MTESTPLSQLPWQVTRDEFLRSAAEVTSGGACCVFVIDDAIPKVARSGYAALVIAYARADEPVCILDDGAAALLVRDGGTASGLAVANRVLEQMRKLALDQTMRAGVASLGSDPSASMRAARDAATAGPAGEITVAS
jgi:hypothetical protein